MAEVISISAPSDPPKISGRTVTNSPPPSPPPSKDTPSKKRRLGTSKPSPSRDLSLSTLAKDSMPYDAALGFSPEFTFGTHVNGQGFLALPFEDLDVSEDGSPKEKTLEGQNIAMLWDAGWAVGCVHPLRLDTLSKTRRREVASVKANFWIRYDDGFYAQRLDR